MNQHHEFGSHVRTARQWAIEKLPMEADDQKSIIEGLFEARERQREEMRKVRERSKYQAHRSAFTERYDVEPLAQRMLLMVHDAYNKNPVRAAKAFTQFIVFSNAAGFNRDVEIVEDENEAVFDRTTAGRGLKGFKPRVHQGGAATSSAPKYPKQLEEYILDKLRQGLEPREGEGAGRPTNDWKVAEYNARLRFEQEQEDARLAAPAEPAAEEQQDRDAAE